MAIGAIQGFKKYGIRVPEDISVVGFDNLPFTEYCSPRLTTIAQNRKQLGIIACALLEQMMEGSPLNYCIARPSLVVRDSTVPPGQSISPQSGA
jgi:DNA-binding LacI/PurR family transcriptional regulator